MRRDMQLSVAQKLQKDRIPSSFKQNVAALECRLKPADELAGDFFDAFTLGRNSIALVIGDVANKGVAASLMTFSLLSMFRNVAKTLKPPCEILKSINRSLISQIKEDGWFATAFYGRLNTSNRILTYSSAGHEMPLWFHAYTRTVEKLQSTGYPLGLFSEFEFETREIQMEMGDRLILFTDGVTDATDENGNRFGHKALIDLIIKSHALTCHELTDELMKAVETFMGDSKQRDDIVLSVLELTDDPWIHKSVIFRDSGTLISEIMEGLAPYNLDSQMAYSIRLAVDEAVSNAWRHGLCEDEDAQFEVSYLISDEGFHLKVKDPGQGFDHESLPDPTVEENLFKSSGRGVFLIRQVMDDVEFNETGNEIIILKRFPPGTDAEDIFDSAHLVSVPALKQLQQSLIRAKSAEPAECSDAGEADTELVAGEIPQES
jgi:anti-sigma regulatory factor (Ser/Thr protein kinase)